MKTDTYSQIGQVHKPRSALSLKYVSRSKHCKQTPLVFSLSQWQWY